jgi:hypothetical protein
MQSERSRTSNKNRSCFVWREYRSWTQRLQKGAPDLFDHDVRRHLIENDTCPDGGSLAWLDDAYLAVHDLYLDAECYSVEKFTEIYSSIRFYHATRSERPDFFRTHGIPLSKIDYLNERAFDIFGRDDAVRAAMEELAENGYASHNGGKVWVCLDKRELETEAGHYLKYGPEYIQAIGARLNRKHELRLVGTPTLIGFDVDVADLPEADLCSVVRAGISTIFENWRRGRPFASTLNFGLGLEVSISPSQIREISHPEPMGDYGY